MCNSILTAVIINYQTPDLTSKAVSSFKLFYPDIPLVLIDNGSKDSSIIFLNELIKQFSKVHFITEKTNLHHGPAMHKAVNVIESDYILFIDSDCEILRSGFIEEMLKIFEKDTMSYAIGKLIYLNKRGFPVEEGQKGIPYIRPICMMIRREFYKRLKPFQKHGSPCLDNMQDAINNGFRLINFDVEKYIHHRGRGTASRYGYNLGLAGKVNYLLNKLKL